MTEREEMIREIRQSLFVNLAATENAIEIINRIMNEVTCIADRYEVQKRSTELVAYNEDINAKVIKQFVIAKTVSGRSERTIRYYVETVKKFEEIVQKDFDKVTAEDIRFYLAKRKLGGTCTDTTLNNERRNLSAFFDWTTTAEYTTRNPVKRTDIIKVAKKKKEAFTDMDIEKIRGACRNAQDTAMVEFLLSTGCRVTEMCEVKLEDIKDDCLTVHGKGNKYRKVYLNARAVYALQAYIAERKDENPYLFPASYSIQEIKKRGIKRSCLQHWYRDPRLIAEGGCNSGSIEGRLRKLGKMAGVEKVHPHRFRRTCATKALRTGMPLEYVSKMLGHESIQTTQIYLDIDEQELEHNHRKYVI